MTQYHYHTLIEAKDYEGALKQVFQAIEDAPDVTEHYVNAAVLLQKFSKTEQAEVFLQKALTLDGESFSALYTLANLYYDSSRYQEASSLYLRAYVENPEDADINFMLAMCYVQLGTYAKALPFFETAYQSDAHDEDILLQYGLACAHLELYPQAETLLNQLNAMKPDADAHYNLGLIAMMNDNKSRAKAHFTSAVELERDHYLALNGLKNLNG